MAASSIDELLTKVPSRFNLVMVAAKRARQIKDGAPRLVPTDSVNPVTVALEEISAGKLVLQDGVIKLLDEFGRPLPAARPELLDELLSLPDDTSADDIDMALVEALSRGPSIDIDDEADNVADVE